MSSAVASVFELSDLAVLYVQRGASALERRGEHVPRLEDERRALAQYLRAQLKVVVDHVRYVRDGLRERSRDRAEIASRSRRNMRGAEVGAMARWRACPPASSANVAADSRRKASANTGPKSPSAPNELTQTLHV